MSNNLSVSSVIGPLVFAATVTGCFIVHQLRRDAELLALSARIASASKATSLTSNNHDQNIAKSPSEEEVWMEMNTNRQAQAMLLDEQDQQYHIKSLPSLHQPDSSTGLPHQGKMIKKFVITGGPCSGKTTAMVKLQVFLRERGFRVFVASEAATILFLNGASFDDMNYPKLQQAFQQFVIRTQITLEDCLYNYALNTNHDCVILCDRGLMDGSAYVDKETWNNVLSEVNLDLVSARDTRYDAVFHLVTCADGAPEYYTLSNNEARSEDFENAIQVDHRLEKAWAGHPHHVIIDNKQGKSFDSKLQELVSSISYYVGLPTLNKSSKKYILVEPPDVSLLPNVQIFDCEKIIMDNDLFQSDRHWPSNTRHRSGKILYSFIRKRSQGTFNSYALTTLKQLETGEEVELKQVITARMYSMLSAYADKSRHIVVQRRYYFLYEQQSFHIYEYIEPESGLWTLQCQSQFGTPKFPPYLNVGSMISRDQSFSSYFISRKDISRANSFNNERSSPSTPQKQT